MKVFEWSGRGVRHGLFALLLCTMTLGSTSAQVKGSAESPIEKVRKAIENQLAPTCKKETSGKIRFIIENPVQAIDPTLDTSEPLGRQILVEILNRAPKSDLFASYGVDTIPSIYKAILQYKEIPTTPFSFSARWRLARDERVLYLPVPWWDTLLGLTSDRARTQEYDLYLSFAKRRSELEVSSAGSAAMQDLDRQWKLTGYKELIETTQLDIQNLSFAYGPSWWRSIRERYDVNVEQFGEDAFPGTFVSPQYASWMKNEGWVAFSLKADGDATVVVQMELKAVEIYRPWLDPSVFTNRAWQWQDGSPYRGALISSGPTDGDRLPDGLLPLIPQVVVLGRKIHIAGPGALPIKANWQLPSGDDVAIIGWLAEEVPRAPDPNPAFQWAKR